MHKDKFLLRFLFILLLSIFTILSVKSQFYNTGQDRGSTKWLQIKTEYFKIVYPEYASKKAQEFANSMLWAIEKVPIGLSSKATKIDIIMHQESVTSNAMVVWAPKRMETFPLPSQDSYAQEWYEQLALHEYRHAVQIDNLNQGVTKVLYYIFGEMGTAAVLGLYIPLWFLEGDAVATETALSSTGRGRMADFEMPLKAQLNEIGSYSYDKATMGSYKSFVPDHYILGYHLVTKAQEKYGNDIWKKTLRYLARNPYNPIAFSHSLRKQSSLQKVAFYEDIMSDLKTIWNKPKSNYSATDTLACNTSKHYTSYQFGQYVNDSILFALKTGLDDVTNFILINTISKKEERLLTPAYSYFYNISLSDSLLCWSERRHHPRWEHVSYSVIMTYNFRTQKKKQLTHKSTLVFPVYNSKSNSIACIKNSKSSENSIIILDAETGNIKREITNNLFIKNLAFSDDGKQLFFYQLQKEGFELIKYNISEELQELVLKPSFNNRNWILVSGESIFYTDDVSGVSNLYLHSTNNNSNQMITNLKFGIHSINMYKKLLVFDSYTSNGWQVNSITKSNNRNYNIKSTKSAFYESYITNDSSNIQTTILRDSIFEEKKYSKFTHLLNFHSWGPISIKAASGEVNPGVSIMSQNLLSTLELSAGYEYLLQEGVNRIYTDISYNALYPRVSLGISKQERKSNYYDDKGNPISYSYNEASVGLNISQGLRLNKGAYSNYIRPLVGLYYQYLTDNKYTPNWFPSNSNLVSMRYGFYAYSYRRRGLKDLNPHWGQNINIEYRHTPTGDLLYGSMFNAETNIYLPGIGKHHNLKVYLAYQKKDADIYSYSNVIQTARGYIGIDANKLQSYQFNYQMPLFYPDMSISSLMYIKRIKTNLFYDLSVVNVKTEDLASSGSDNINYISYGLDLRFDLHIFRTLAPFDLGVRYAYLDMDDSSYFQFLFNVSL